MIANLGPQGIGVAFLNTMSYTAAGFRVSASGFGMSVLCPCIYTAFHHCEQSFGLTDQLH